MRPLFQAVSYAASVTARAFYRGQAITYAALLILQWLTEHAARACGFDALIFCLVALALLSLDALSVLYIAAAGLGMFHRHTQVQLWLPRAMAVVLTAALLLQYTFLLPPWPAHAPRQAGPVASWLGLAATKSAALGTFVTLGVAAACMCSTAWHADADTTHHTVSDVSDEDLPTAGNGSGSSGAGHRGAAKLHHLIAQLPPQRHSAHIRLRATGAVMQRSSNGERSADTSNAYSDSGALILACSPRWGIAHSMPVHERTQWGWPDHLRFWLLRFSLDALMIFVVGLCCIQRDLIHAAYLALTLFFFRRREVLRLRGNEVFIWMPFANYCVIVAFLLFQAPVDRLWRLRSSDGDPSEHHQALPQCTFAALLGLHRIPYAGHWRVFVAPHGAGLPLLMWLVMQVRTAATCEACCAATHACE